MKFDKDTYYKIYGCSNVQKIDKQNYLLQHKSFVDAHVSNDYDEFKPNGKRRLELGTLIFLTKRLCEMLGDEQFTKDFNDYLALVEYDEDQIREERDKEIQRILTNKSATAIVSGNRN